MKRAPRPDELRLWARVAATVRPGPGRCAPADEALMAAATVATESALDALHPTQASVPPAKSKRVIRPISPPEAIEPGRMRRLTREREAIGPRLDLHGLDRDRARAALEAFLRRARDDGWRAALVITGKGALGDGVLRRSAPEWLAEPNLRDVVAGVSTAHRRHGGDGALYVALKRPAAKR